MDTILQWIARIGGMLAFILAGLKIREYWKNRPRLVYKYRRHYFEIEKTVKSKKTHLCAIIDITNAGPKTIIIKDIMYGVLDGKKKRMTTSARIVPVERGKRKLGPGDYTTVAFVEIINGELLGEKYFFKLEIETSLRKHQKLIKLTKTDRAKAEANALDDLAEEKKRGFIY